VTNPQSGPLVVTPQQVQAAKLLKRLNDADGLATDPVTLAIASAQPIPAGAGSLKTRAVAPVLGVDGDAAPEGHDADIQHSDGHAPLLLPEALHAALLQGHGTLVFRTGDGSPREIDLSLVQVTGTVTVDREILDGRTS
jgi:hypothetical protein